MLSSTLLAALALTSSAHAASPGKADICHWNGATFEVIEVSVRAVSQHIAQHGDSPVSTYFVDADADGFGDAAGDTVVCPTEGYVADATDCDDDAADVNPAAAEVPYDGVDNDCADGTRDDDLDEDGFLLAEDCDDADATVNPGAEEVCDNEVDDNCDGNIDEGCESDCPCFTGADIDAAYNTYLEFVYGTDYDYEYNYAQCYEYVVTDSYYYNYSYDYTYVYFNHEGYTYDPYAYEYAYAGFYGLSEENDGYYSYDVCNDYQNRYAWDGANYQSEYLNDYQYVTAEQAEACEQVVRDWATANGIECPTYTYSY